MSDREAGTAATSNESWTLTPEAPPLCVVTPADASETTSPASHRPRYLSVPVKLGIAIAFALLWFCFCAWLAMPWIRELAQLFGWPTAILIPLGVALIPGMANAFLITGLVLDRRPQFRTFTSLPPVTILIAAYNEADYIRDTLASLSRQNYDAALEILVIDDGSTDRTRDIVREVMATMERPPRQSLTLLEMPQNVGKAHALTTGLAHASHELIITLDADTMVYRDAISRLVINQLSSPAGTAATAGTVLVRNSRKNLITRLQEWDYFLGIAVVKRVQSLLQGTLVAQGAFSIYRRDILREVGGWPDTVGEDIVLTWAILERGHRVGYAENAFVFTNVPETYRAYYHQRKRWSRGLIEAFKQHPSMLVPRRLNAPFVYLNLAFPYLDFVYLFVFLPGIVAAVFFQNYTIVGMTTLMVLPLALLVNLMMYLKQLSIFRRYGLVVRRNILGAVVFTLGYQLALAPASLAGYLAEMAGLRKKW